jgi:hypothetical protein
MIAVFHDNASNSNPIRPTNYFTGTL